MTLALTLAATWVVGSVPAALLIGRFVRVGRGPEPTEETR